MSDLTQAEATLIVREACVIQAHLHPSSDVAGVCCPVCRDFRALLVRVLLNPKAYLALIQTGELPV